LLGQSHWKWPTPWQQWHLMSDVHPVGTEDDERFVVAAPYETKVLLWSVARGAAIEGVDDVEGVRETEGVIEERAPEGIAVLDGVVGAERGMKEVFVFIVWHPCKSFSTNITS
jgi:hypothetical protein